MRIGKYAFNKKREGLQLESSVFLYSMGLGWVLSLRISKQNFLEAKLVTKTELVKKQTPRECELSLVDYLRGGLERALTTVC